MTSNSPPQYDSAILDYLRQQEGYSDEEYNPPSISSSQQFVKEFLEDLLFKVERNTLWRERYKELKREHNQYCLFDILHIIPDLVFDDELVNELLFKETLLISSLDPLPKYDKIGALKVVGSFCLDIKLSEGKLLKDPIPDCDTFERELLSHCKQIKEAFTSTRDRLSSRDELLFKEIDELEEMLNKQIAANQNKFLVFCTTKFGFGECSWEAGSESLSWVNRYCHTLEEKRKEYVFEDGVLNQKTCYCAMQQNRYYIRHTSTKEKLDSREYYSMAKMQRYLGEGASFLIMRILVLTRYMGTFEMSTTYINGDLCRNIYESKGPRLFILGGQSVESYKIYRTIIEKCGLVHRSSTLFTTHGRILTHEWEGNQYTLNINPKLTLKSPLLPKIEYEPLLANWAKDLELLSKYMDEKTKAELRMKAYMSDHPEIKDVISDFLQHLLQLKPDKVIEFTCEYFKKHLPFKGDSLISGEDDIPFYIDL